MVLLYEVNGRAKQFFEIQGCGHMIEEFRRHGHIYIYVAAFVMLVASNGAKETHGSYAESLLKLVSMTSNDIYILASRFHSKLVIGYIFSAKV